LQFCNIIVFSDFCRNIVVLPSTKRLNAKWARRGQEMWPYNTWFSKRAIHYAYTNFKGDNVKQSLMLKHNSTETSQ